jgi:hypothetical protein
MSGPRPPTPPPEPEAAPQPTVKFPSRLPELLRKLGTEELEYERKRLDARKKRLAEKAKKDQESSLVSPEDTIGSPAASTPKEISTPTELKISKKERERQAKANQTEEVLRASANQTAAMALGRFGSSKKYSWMTKGAGGGGGGLATGAGQRERLASQATGSKTVAKDAPPKPAEDPALISKKSFEKYGLLKEAPTVQLRDVVNVLESGGKEKRALVRAYQKLGSEK